MELDDLKNSWQDIQAHADKKQNINYKMIDKMTTTKYKARMKRIAYPEIIGTIVCFLGAVYIAADFSKLNTIFLQSTAVLAILLLLMLPAISVMLLWQFNKTGDTGQPYAETLKKFAAQKIRFYKFQKASALLSYILLVAVIILIPVLFGGKDLADNKYFWILAIPLGYIFLLFFSKWVLKNYKQTLEQSEQLLRELRS